MRSARLRLGPVATGFLALSCALGCGSVVDDLMSGTGGGATTTNAGGTSVGGASTGGVGGASTGGVGGAVAGGMGGVGGAGAGGTGGVIVETCVSDSTPATVYQVNDPNAPGAIGEDIRVRLDGVIATSPKYLVSHSAATGSCLWGVLVSAPDSADGSASLLEAAAFSGLLVLSYGPIVPSEMPCPGQEASIAAGLEGDMIPDDVKPGDVLDMVGTTSKFILIACSVDPSGSDIDQTRLVNPCKIEKTGLTLPVPSPHLLTYDDLALLGMQHVADPGAEAFHRAWGSVRVRTPAVTPKQFSGMTCGPTMTDTCCLGVDPCTVDPQGTLVLAEGDVRVPDSLYVDGSATLCHTKPQFPNDPAPQFDHVQGVVQLDFCTWGLSPIDKCSDYSPSPDDCAAAGVVSCF